jgi:hypothetical protein
LAIRCCHFFYNASTADLVLASENSQLRRINLEYGRFMASIAEGSAVANVVTYAPAS